MTPSGVKHRAFPLREVKFADADDGAPSGAFVGYASVFGILDHDGDIVDRGAFAKTIAKSAGRVPMLWQHNPLEPIGISVAMSEDEHGLRVEGQVNLETSRGRDAYHLLRQGALKGLSIGYFVLDAEHAASGAYHLREIELLEFSAVTFPANEHAVVVGMKHADGDEPAGEVRRVAGAVAHLGEATKEGRRLSAASLEKLRAALAALQELVAEGAAPDDDNDDGKAADMDPAEVGAKLRAALADGADTTTPPVEVG